MAGAQIAAYAKHLVGVDLSEKMLEKARALDIYHRLEQADLLTMLRAEPAASFDLIIAADVLVYMGRLDELVAEVRRTLRADGDFAFSVENLDALKIDEPGDAASRDFRLNRTARFAHSKAYLARLAVEHGFIVRKLEHVQGRVNEGIPVEGYLAFWRSA